MLTVHDVASAILDRSGPIEAKKLQKLVYYAQAWHLAWYGEQLFDEPIEAWTEGPVARALYTDHRQQWMVDKLPRGDGERLSGHQKLALDAVLARYGEKTPSQLVAMTHREAPWLLARGDLPPRSPSNRVISQESMKNYYREYGGIDLPTTDESPAPELAARVRKGDISAVADFLGGHVAIEEPE